MFSHDEIEEITSWLKSPTLEKVVRQIEEKHTAAWQAAQDSDARERCWRMLQAIRQLVDELQLIVGAKRIDQFNANRARANNWKLPEATRPEG